jgi:bacteriocin biosynthesis cyclodehydratase domain-containing protein
VSGPLQFKRHLVIEILPGPAIAHGGGSAEEGLFILSEAGEYAFRGPAFVAVAQAIDGRRNDDQIVASLAGTLPPAQLYYAIATLRRDGFVDESIDLVDGLSEREAAFWDAVGAEPAALAFELVGIGDVELPTFAAKLRALGHDIVEHAQHVLVLTDDYLRPQLGEFEQQARAAGRDWLLAKPLGLVPWIGPRFRHDRPGCWACLEHRLRGHRRVQQFLHDHTGRREPYPTSIAALPATIDVVAGLLSTVMHGWAARPTARTQAPRDENQHPLDGVVVSFDPRALVSTRHVLTARPQCPRCGDSGLLARLQSQPITLAPRPAEVLDGGRRSQDPHATYARLEHHISPITGIVSRMVRSTPADSTVSHAYYTDHNFVHMTRNLEFLRISLRSFSGGKGRSDIQARTGALCESIERYSGVFQGDEAMRMASYTELRECGELVVHPNAMMLYSDAQLAERERWNATGELFSWVPQRFDEHARIAWTPAWSLTDTAPRWLPTALCFYNADSPMMRADSNGAAAGNNLEEAILQGFMELVERDAVALWWYNRLSLPGVDLASFAEPYFERVVAEMAAQGRELWVLELPCDLQVPCYAAISRRVDHACEQIVFGLGAHLDATLALSRAITEHNQFLPHVSATSHPATSVAGRWYREARIEHERYLAPTAAAPRRRDDHPRYDASHDLEAELLRCAQLVRARGLELLVQDHTRPDTDLCVAKVTVPGLRHFWARLGPGRLYDVPVALGLREQPTPESELNPVPMFV